MLSQLYGSPDRKSGLLVLVIGACIFVRVMADKTCLADQNVQYGKGEQRELAFFSGRVFHKLHKDRCLLA